MSDSICRGTRLCTKNSCVKTDDRINNDAMGDNDQLLSDGANYAALEVSLEKY